MEAIAIVPGSTQLDIIVADDPVISVPDEVKLRVLNVGICGTDREEVSGGRATAPEGSQVLIIGHEMLGEVIETGVAVTKVRKGDLAVLTVRRPCGQCPACALRRSDMCFTGRYTERGIKGAHGFQSQFVVDREEYLVKVPAEIKDVAVLTEPMSIAIKAIDEAEILQRARLGAICPDKNWFRGKKALVAGVGAVGLLAAFALRLRGAFVTGLDIVSPDGLRPRILREIGGKYIDGRKLMATDIDEHCGESDFIFEAAGIAKLQIELIDALGINGVYVATGIPGGDRPLTTRGGELLKQMVLKNQVIVGSVNASVQHYQTAVNDISACNYRWRNSLNAMITSNSPYTKFREVLQGQGPGHIKEVLSWA